MRSWPPLRQKCTCCQWALSIPFINVSVHCRWQKKKKEEEKKCLHIGWRGCSGFFCVWVCGQTGHSLHKTYIRNGTVSAHSASFQSFDLFRQNACINTQAHAFLNFDPPLHHKRPLLDFLSVWELFSILYHTWSERRSRSCIRLLKDKVIVNKQGTIELSHAFNRHSCFTSGTPGCSWVSGELHFPSVRQQTWSPRVKLCCSFICGVNCNGSIFCIFKYILVHLH